LPIDKVTDEMFNLVAGMINDPQESWWVAYTAMNALGRARGELVSPHVDRLAYWLKHDEWWLRMSALTAITPVVAEKRFYKQVLPEIGNMVATNQRCVALNPLRGIVRKLQSADPKIQKFAIGVFIKAYKDFPRKLVEPGGQDLTSNIPGLVETIASSMAALDGGFDELYRIAPSRYPDQALPHKSLYLAADSSKFGPKLKKAFIPIIINELIPEYIGNNRTRLQAELKSNMPNRTVDGLVALYRNAGIDDYDWKRYGPKRTEIKWDYHSFDPQDGKLWEDGFRYRKVDWPAGMENWFASEFAPKSAGWKTGYAPFGSYDGKKEFPGRCKGNFCGCGEPIKTLWDKEVLMMQADIKLPPLKDGYAYRILVGGRSHVNAGDGSDVWIDGKYMAARRKTDPSISGVGKRQGGKPWGRTIDDTFRAEFADGKVTVSVTGFMRYKKRTRTKANRQSFWFQEMKLPTVTDADIFEAAKYTALKSTEYFVEMDVEKMYRWGGKFVPNPKILGNWQVINQVPTVEDFTADTEQADLRRVPFKSVTFKNDAKTDNKLRFWSGDTLIDLNQNFALKMVLKKIGGTEYLFIEAGQIPRRVEAGWKPNFLVLKRK
jgi:hypothetical protein